MTGDAEIGGKVGGGIFGGVADVWRCAGLEDARAWTGLVGGAELAGDFGAAFVEEAEGTFVDGSGDVVGAEEFGEIDRGGDGDEFGARGEFADGDWDGEVGGFGGEGEEENCAEGGCGGGKSDPKWTQK